MHTAGHSVFRHPSLICCSVPIFPEEMRFESMANEDIPQLTNQDKVLFLTSDQRRREAGLFQFRAEVIKMIRSEKEHKKQLYYAIMATFFWGMLAHGYGFLHNSFSGDSLSEFFGAMGSNAWKIQLGRFVVPAYKAVFRTDLTLPWLVGMLSLLWIGLAVYLTVRIFRMESGILIFLTAGIFAANITVAATAASYLHDYDCNMFALLCAVAAVYLWKEFDWGILAGSVLVALSLGIYQSYVLVAVVLVMFSCILDLLNEADFRDVIKRGLKAVSMLVLGGVLYYGVLRIVIECTGIQMHTGDTNSLDAALALTPRSILSLTYHAYLDCFNRLIQVQSPYPARMIQIFTLLQMLVAAGALVIGLCNRRVKLPEKALCMILVALLPFGMHLIYVLTSGIVHDLMVYGTWLFYLLVLLLSDWLAKYGMQYGGGILQKYRSVPRWLCMGMLFVILYGNVQTANALYLKKDLEQDAYLALMNRIVYRMETVEGYEPGETPVVFVGTHQLLNEAIPGFEEYRHITGMDSSLVANTEEDYRLRAYFQTVMNYPANIPGSDVFRRMAADPRVTDMPAYPGEGSIAMIDDVLVVKLG